MARQGSIIKLNGTIGGINFYKSKDGYLVREKGGVSAERIRKDPTFQRTRENGSEFGRAGSSGKILRNSIRPLLQKASDSRMVSRLTKEMIKVIQMDQTSPRGQRNVIDGEAVLLNGFEFNINGKLGNTLYAPKTLEITRTSGLCKVNIPAFAPTVMIAAPSGTTHFKLLSAAVAVDFEHGTFETQTNASDVIEWNDAETQDLILDHELSPNSVHPIFLMCGVEFYQDVNGQKYPLRNGAYNALSIVKVDTPV